MKIISHEINNVKIAEIISEDILIQDIQDAVDLIGNIYYQGFDNIILYNRNLPLDFFELRNKMAGEILEKFSMYRLRLILIVDYAKFTSTSLKSFIYESNNGRQVNFVTSLKEALYSLTY